MKEYKLTIGIFIPNLPAYSETFFRSKIIGLLQNNYSVILFTGYSKKSKFDLCRSYSQYKIYKNVFIQAFALFIALLKLFIFKPHVFINYFKLERNAGNSIKVCFENMYINCHILTQKLDWLHFGYATMALRRENVAKSIGALMAVSLRGFDIAIYPLKHSGCYSYLWTLVDKVHVISNDLLNLAYSNGLSRSVPVQKITPAIDIDKFRLSFSKRIFNRNSIQIITVSRLHWKKGLEYILEALAILNSRNIKFQFTVVGEGVEYERLKYASFQLDLDDKIIFAGKMTQDQVKLALENSDIYLQYSISEGFCNAVLEAQAMGCLCVVSDAEGLSENVLNNHTGWVVPKRNPLMLANTIENILNISDVELNLIRDNAIDRVKRDFNISNQIDLFQKFYNL